MSSALATAPYTAELFSEMESLLASRMAGIESMLRNLCDNGAARAAAASASDVAGAVQAAVAQAIAANPKLAMTVVPTSTPGGACPTPTVGGPAGQCLTYATQILLDTYRRCQGLVRDPCDVQALNDAALASAYPLIQKFIGMQEMNFYPSGAAGTGLNAEGQPTVFQANWPVAAGQSILLEQDPAFPLDWRPGCIDPSLVFSDGEDKDNYKLIRMSVWVALKSQEFNTNPANPIGYYGEKWNDFQKILGKEFVCGDECKKVAILGPLGCVDIDRVGREARLLIQIDNLTGASESAVNGSTLKVTFAGFRRPCCDECGMSGGTKCSCSH